MLILREREGFPKDAGSTCRCLHCGQRAAILEETKRMVWVCSCGAAGYYDDGKRKYPESKYRAPTPKS